MAAQGVVATEAQRAANEAARCAVAPLLKDAAFLDDGDDGAPFAVRWHELMQRPLPKGVKYVKALHRLLGSSGACLYHLVEYKDPMLLQDERVGALLRVPQSKDEWALLQVVSRAVQCAVDADVVHVPSPAEIQANIEQQRASKRSNEAGSVSQSFKAALSDLATTLELPAMQQRVDAADAAELCGSWAAMCQATPGTHDGACADPAAYTALARAEAEALVARREEPGVAQALLELHRTSALTQNIPTGVMSKIESMASSLASDLQSGSTSLASMDLASIGERVLSQCDAAEISQLSSNLATLMPLVSGAVPPQA